MLIRTALFVGLFFSLFMSAQAQGSEEDWEFLPIVGDFVGAGDV